MKRGFIRQILSAKELYQRMELFADAGVDVEKITIDDNFEAFSKTVVSGDTVVVDSYCVAFNSLDGFLAVVVALASRGVAVESLLEPGLRIDADNVELFRSLEKLGVLLRKNMTQKGIDKAVLNGKKLGRPIGSTKVHNKVVNVEKLCSKMDLSVAEACRRTGCNPRTYYRYKHKSEMQITE